MSRYAEVSRLVREVFNEFSPIVEPLSLDEAFLDLTGAERLLGPLLAIGYALKRRMVEKTGLIVSVGIAPIKIVAKILSDMSKPDGMLLLGPEHIRDFLNPLPVDRLWGVGRVTLERMHSAGIRTIGDLANRDPAGLHALFGSLGTHLYELASGRDARTVVGDWQRKSYGEENTFDHDLKRDSFELKRVLIAHAEAIGRRLRSDQVRARTITVKIKLARPLGDGRYPIITRARSLPDPTHDTEIILRTALGLIDRIPNREKIRLAGLQASHLYRTDVPQFGLFDGWQVRAARSQRLNQALDSVTKRFGDSAITRGLARADRASPSRRIK